MPWWGFAGKLALVNINVYFKFVSQFITPSLLISFLLYQNPTKSAMVMKHKDSCVYNIFLYTSLACSSDLEESLSNSVQESCVLRVPGFDQKLDLKALTEKSFYTVYSGFEKRESDISYFLSKGKH